MDSRKSEGEVLEAVRLRAEARRAREYFAAEREKLQRSVDACQRARSASEQMRNLSALADRTPWLQKKP